MISDCQLSDGTVAYKGENTHSLPTLLLLFSSFILFFQLQNSLSLIHRLLAIYFSYYIVHGAIFLYEDDDYERKKKRMKGNL
jgi:hypothetical protein